MGRLDELMIKEDETITAAQHEKEMTRMETANKRWFISFMVVLLMLFASNVAWVIYESQYQDVVITQDEVQSSNNFVGNGGDIYNGQADD